MKKSTYRRPSQSVSTVKKSHAIIDCACARRNSRQQSPALAAAEGTSAWRRILATVVADTRTPKQQIHQRHEQGQTPSTGCGRGPTLRPRSQLRRVLQATRRIYVPHRRGSARPRLKPAIDCREAARDRGWFTACDRDVEFGPAVAVVLLVELDCHVGRRDGEVHRLVERAELGPLEPKRQPRLLAQLALRAPVQRLARSTRP